MKHLKLVGLAAVAAAALMASVGAGTASAAPVICSTTVNPCPAAQMWPNFTAIDFSSESTGKVLFLDTSGFTQNSCESTIKGTLTSNTTGAPLLSGISMTWANCTRTVANVNIGVLSIDTITGSSNGIVAAQTEFQVTTKFPGFFGEVSCIYKATAGHSLGTLTASTATAVPTMDIETVVTPIAGQPSECPSTLRWQGKYKLTSPVGTTGSVSHN